MQVMEASGNNRELNPIEERDDFNYRHSNPEKRKQLFSAVEML